MKGAAQSWSVFDVDLTLRAEEKKKKMGQNGRLVPQKFTAMTKVAIMVLLVLGGV